MRTRSWSIRSKIIALAAVPLTALLALWAFATAITAGPALNLLTTQSLLDDVGDPGSVLVGELQRERRLSVEFLSNAKTNPGSLDTQRATTDRAAAEFRRTAVSAVSSQAERVSSGTLSARIKQLINDLDGLPAARGYIDDRDVDVVGAQNLYSNIVDTSFQMFAATATFGDERVDREIRGLSNVGRGREYLSRVDSLLAGARVAGKLSAGSRAEIVQAIGTARFLIAQGVSDLPVQDRTAYQTLSAGTAFNRLGELQNELLTSSRAGVAVPVPADAWQPAYDTTIEQLRVFETNASDSLSDDARPVAVNVLLRLGLAGLLGLVALVLSVLVSIRVGRSIVGRLIRLRGEALEMADERLPAVVRRLQRGEAVDVEVETPPLEYGRDEIGQLGHAFNEVQRTAVQSAVEEASVRRGINEVFLNIARRSQTLLHRQLALLDKMERRETEPDELEDLYRVDHLATRMRRHAEDLVILAGAAPGRGWRNPVPLIDVIRGAISEVEDYKRVDIQSIQPSAVLGRAVGDVIHLLAELLENAASFSPPTTRVQVVGQILPNGYAVEIEDRGLGMSAEAITEANRKLLEPPDFDPTDSARLGLFVVAQLAARQGIRVSLRPSAYGGVTAIVLIPGELITAAPPGPGSLTIGPGPAPSTPAEAGLDRPLNGTGTDDRSSLAALQWQGTEELRSITTPTRPAPANGKAVDGLPTALSTSPGTLDRPGTASEPAAEGADLVTGPTPSAVVDGLTPDGLVQRRRGAPRKRNDGRTEPLAQLTPNLDTPDALTAPTGPTPAVLPPAAPAAPDSPGPVVGDGLDVEWPSGNDPMELSTPTLPSRARRTPAPRTPDERTPAEPTPAPRIPATRIPAQRTPAESIPPAAPSVLPGSVPPSEAASPALPGAGNRERSAAAVEDASRLRAAFAGSVDSSMDSPLESSMEEPGEAPADERLLPRRVRQSHLAPQLRGPVVERAEATTTRSPEKVRSLMSALQQGTTRGRRDAAALTQPPQPDPGSVTAASDRAAAGSERNAGEGDEQARVTDKQQTTGQPTWSEAATVTFPAVRISEADGTDGGTDGPPGDVHQIHRPEKDA
ncbi:hypothetical protein GCM10010435_51690 [Winogradskya consettensis]|uniref:histidine kinase n=1 Tax=Winogradskya consettensis TaxID=113560 RepID=A0A919VWK7_9ACTN|nr:nitrate- and nitrite sensing domain-containing protein [Actinoplanes consettensis]GIM71923.1 hypothetical protein Aco04nite_27740 [Actinoplanes consettensis]